MNSPYMGKFQVTQEFKGADHDGLDLVGLHDKEVHSTVNGTVRYAGWENSNNHKQGFGQYVCIRSDTDGYYYYFGHLSELKVKTGDKVKITDVVGIEGHTGYTIPDGPGGSHYHYCVRKNYAKGNFLNVGEISGIPNKLGTYDDGYLDRVAAKEKKEEKKPKQEMPDPKTTETFSPNHDTAMKFDDNLTGAYAVIPLGGLNVRKGAGINKERITTLPWNTIVQCYGYYTEVGGIKWYLIKTANTEGFVSSQYLARS